MNNYIAEFLRRNNYIGAENGIKSGELLRSLGRYPSADAARVLKSEVQEYRRKWEPSDGIENYILSDTNNGYYLPASEQEAARFLKIQDGRAYQSFVTVKALRACLKSKGFINAKSIQTDNNGNEGIYISDYEITPLL